MPSKGNKRRSLSQLITIRFTLLIFLTNFLIIILIFFLLRSELSKKDQSIARIHFHEISEVIESNGVDFLKIQAEREEFNDLDNLIIIISDGSGRIFLQQLPTKINNFDMSDINSVLKIAEKKDGHHTVYSKQPFQETIEIYSGQASQYRLTVGFNTDASEDFVNLYFKLAVILNLIAGLCSISIGYYFSKKSLHPIRELIQAVKKIRSGDMNTSLVLLDKGDELSELTHLFNDMILQIQKLIYSLQTSIDYIAHDLRTPLTHLTNKIENLLKEGKFTFTREMAEELMEETQSLTSLINTLLEISEADSQSLILRKEVFNLNQLIHECVELYEYVSEDKNANIQVLVAEEYLVKADRNKIKRVLANLIDNALKYSNAEPKIIIQCERKDEVLHLSIQDNGVGIAKNDIPKIWQRLYRGDTSRTTSGMGLGLSFVKSILDSHQWSIYVEPLPNQAGARFVIEIPLSDLA